MKKVAFGAKPTVPTNRLSPDKWVNDRHSSESMKRFTIDVPVSLHKRVKTQCAIQGVKMADVIRDMLEKHFPEEYPQRTGDSSSIKQ